MYGTWMVWGPDTLPNELLKKIRKIGFFYEAPGVMEDNFS